MAAAEWWTKINSAARFIADILECVKNRNSVVVNISDVPFAEEFAGITQNELRRNDSEYILELINDSETNLAVEDFLFGKYCPDDVASTFFPTLNNTKARFIAQCEQFRLNTSTVWVNVTDEQRISEWISFIKEYTANCSKLRHTVFVIQTNNSNLQSVKAKGLKYISTADYITTYDYYVYYMLEASEISGCTTLKKQYIAELLASFCKNDAMTAEKMLSRWNKLVENPLELYEECSSQKVPNSELQSRLWRTQMRVLFPAIEEYRYQIVQKYYDCIQNALPFETVYKVEITEAFELDLGNILSMNYNGDISLRQSDMEMIIKLKSIRDNLAHMKPSSYFGIEVLLN